jgi:predicted nucleic acid-binding protein
VILVDTSVWAPYFSGRREPHVERLELALTLEEDLVTTPLIVTETLQGFRTEHGFKTARNMLLQLPSLTLDMEGHVEAARLFRRMRAKDITVRGAVDCILAQTAMQHGAEILAHDGDFEGIARHLPLRLTRVETA